MHVSRIIGKQTGERLLLLGNEAVARGAIEAGVRVATAYPGTPSSEIMETLLEAADKIDLYAQWSINEKVAFDMAAGASLTGVRAMSSMKSAGLNVAMDLFMTLPYGGVRGGLVIAVADDPLPSYSSSAQDSRVAAEWAQILCLEPENQQEAKDMTKAAFLLSEQFELPVMVRVIGSLSHSSGVVVLGEIEPSGLQQGFNKHWKLDYRWGVHGLPGAGAEHVKHLLRNQYPHAEFPPLGKSGWKQAWLASRFPFLREASDDCEFNNLEKGELPIGVVASGMGAAYMREAIQDLDIEGKLWFLKVGVVHPLPREKALLLMNSCKQLLVIENGAPVIERQLRSIAQENNLSIEIRGRMFDAAIAPYGDVEVNLVRQLIARFIGRDTIKNQQRSQIKEALSTLAIPRSSTLCAGCPHMGSYIALRRAMKLTSKDVPIINVDIGCYGRVLKSRTGDLPEPEKIGIWNEDSASQLYPSQLEDFPSKRHRSNVLYNLGDTCYVMGSSVSMAMGQIRAGYQDGQVLAIVGDSTFFHACIPALVDAVWNQTKLTLLVLDNRWTAMTGQQPSPVTGLNRQGETSSSISIESLAKSIGAGLVEVTDAFDMEMTIKTIKKALDYEGVSVVVSQGECKLQELRRVDIEIPLRVDENSCTGCTICLQLGCPGITFEDRIAGIDPLQCVNCGLCIQLCPEGAISEEIFDE
jgi:indolepyruvate ferredoxin oxidoreductase, alpha subunit